MISLYSPSRSDIPVLALCDFGTVAAKEYIQIN